MCGRRGVCLAPENAARHQRRRPQGKGVIKLGPVRLAASTGPARHIAYLPKYGVQKLAGPIQVDCIAVCAGPPDDVAFAGTPP
ncbi:hypothetical protein B0G73_113190 [Paraburkholderia sp. BL25I1N1]|nr:hypothetical protein B0G73_113190 [Paraburkholderia sp. BL25I1N1]